MTPGDELAQRLSHAAVTVRRIAALDAAARDRLDDAVLTCLVTRAGDETDVKARVLVARAIERHAPGGPRPERWLPALDAAAASCDEPLGRHALLLARDAVEASIVRE